MIDVTGKNIYDLYSTLLSNLVAFGDIRCGFPGGLVVRNPLSVQETQVPARGSERSPGGGSGSSLQCSFLGKPMDRVAWRATSMGLRKSWTWLSH